MKTMVRQIIHGEAQTGKEKAVSAVERMRQINSHVTFNAVISKLTPENSTEIINAYDIVVDATDNIDARYAINDCCVILRKPFISGSAVSMDGQVTTVIPYDTPCYRCLYPNLSVTMGGCRSCADAGVLGPVPGLIGCLQAIEVMKLLLNKGKYVSTTRSAHADLGGIAAEAKGMPRSARNNGRGATQLKPLLGRQLLYDGVCGEFHEFALPHRRRDCAVCGDCPTIRTMRDSAEALTAGHTVASTSSSSHPAEPGAVFSTHTGADQLATTGGSPPPSDENSLTGMVAEKDAASTAQPLLPGEHRISATDFAAAIQEATPSLIIDVRSAEQFSILHLQAPHIAAYPSPSACIAALTSYTNYSAMPSSFVVNVPLNALRGGKTAADRADNQSAVLRELGQVRSLLEREAKGCTAPVKTYVLCRRGVDSVTATQLLLSQAWGKDGKEQQGLHTSNEGSSTPTVSVWNVDGGLTAWSRDVDPTMEMY
jgi:molybdopterin/thiamine biosynthesis adenylyltransferase/rhodanese-related sulfurtransferase